MRRCENNSPFGGYFGPPFAGMGRHPFGGSFRGGDNPDHYAHKPSFGPFGWRRFDRSPERHFRRESEHPRWRRSEQGHRGYTRYESSECNCCRPHSHGYRQERGCHSPGTNRHHSCFGRSSDQHCCGRPEQTQCCESSSRRRCERPSQRSECSCHQASCCDQRRHCHDSHCDRHSRKVCCDNLGDSDPCCNGNKEENEQNHDDNEERKDDEPASERDNKIQMVILWLLRELFWKTLKSRQISDTNMEIIITSTTALQRFLGWDFDK